MQSPDRRLREDGQNDEFRTYERTDLGDASREVSGKTRVDRSFRVDVRERCLQAVGLEAFSFAVNLMTLSVFLPPEYE